MLSVGGYPQGEPGVFSIRLIQSLSGKHQNERK